MEMLELFMNYILTTVTNLGLSVDYQLHAILLAVGVAVVAPQMVLVKAVHYFAIKNIRSN